MPRIVPSPVSGLVRVTSCSPRTGEPPFANPKSMTFTPAFVSSTFPGFRSRCYSLAIRGVERVRDLPSALWPGNRATGEMAE